MLPVNTSNYMADLNLRNAIFHSQIDLSILPGSIFSANLFDVLLSEPARINLFTLYLSALRITIGRVDSHRTKEKMPRIYTRRVITLVAYKHIFRGKIVVCNRIRNAVGFVSLSPDLEASITLSPFVAYPCPAGIISRRPIHQLPESGDYIFIKHGETPKRNASPMVGESRQRPGHKGRAMILFDILSLARLMRIIAHKFVNIKSAIVSEYAPGERPALVREHIKCSY